MKEFPRRLLRVGATAVVLGTALSLAAREPEGRIVFRSERGAGYEIYSMHAAGGELLNLSNAPHALDDMPDWSPDGSRVVFVSTRDSNDEIYVMDATGANQRRITSHPAIDWRPKWSPDGARIAFMRVEGHASSVLVMDADGTGVRTVALNAKAPDWSSDGAELVFVSTDDGRLYRVRSDGGERRAVGGVRSWGRATAPAWSPDGSPIVFALRDGERASRLFVTTMARGETRVVITGAGHATSPAWTSDGAHLIFTSGVGRQTNLFRVDPDGSDLRPLTGGRARDDHASWVGVEPPPSPVRRRPSAWGKMRQIGFRR